MTAAIHPEAMPHLPIAGLRVKPTLSLDAMIVVLAFGRVLDRDPVSTRWAPLFIAAAELSEAVITLS